MDLIIKNGLVILADKIIKANIGIEEGIIKTIDEKTKRAETIIDARNKLVIPGLINNHIHSSGFFFKGIVENKNLHDFDKTELINNIWDYMDEGMTASMIKTACEITFLEAIKSGATTINEISNYDIHQEEIFNVIKKYKLNALVSLSGYEKVDEFKKRFPKQLVGFNLSEEENLKKEELENAGNKDCFLHMHVAETIRRADLSMKKFGKSIIEVLKEHNLLNNKTILSHGVHLSNNDIRIIKENNCKIVNTPVAEMKLGDGIAKIPAMIKEGILVGLGTDGAGWNNTNDLFREMKTFCLLHKLISGPQSITPEQAFQSCTINNAGILGLEKKTGSISIGKQADLALIDYNKPHLMPLIKRNALNNLILCANASDVSDVIIKGQLIMQDREVKVINEERVLKNAQKVFEEVLSKNS